jgi:hypothetical protein
LGLREDAKQKADHQWLYEKAIRTLKKVKARRFSQAYLAGIRLVPQSTPSGIALSPALSIPQDGMRVIKVVCTIMKQEDGCRRHIR